MNLFMLTLVILFFAGIPLSKADPKWSYLFALLATLGLSFAYFFLNQI